MFFQLASFVFSSYLQMDNYYLFPIYHDSLVYVLAFVQQVSESEYYSDESNRYEDKWWMPSYLRDGHYLSGSRIRKRKYYKDDASSQKGQTPLHLAAKNGHLSMCRWIMENKADTDIEPVDYHGKTPLHVAAEHGHLEICKLIVQNMQDTKSKKNDHV